MSEITLPDLCDIYAHICNVTPVGGWEYFPASKRLHLTPQIGIILRYDLGFEPNDLYGMFHTVVDEDSETIWAAITLALKDSKPWALELRITNDDEPAKTIYSDVVFIPLTDGEVKLVGCIEDVSEKKRHLTDLKTAYAELNYGKSALNHHAIVSMFDEYGRVFYVNKKFCEISGYAFSELVGVDYKIVNSGFHSEEFWLEFWRILTTKSVWYGEISNRNQAGDLYWLQLTVVPHLNEDGFVDRYISIGTDITERKFAFQEKSRLQRALYQSQKMEAIGRLVSGIAHDFNNILTSSIGYAELIEISLAQNKVDKIERYLGFIKSAGERGQALAGRMLNFGRKSDLCVRVFNPVEVLHKYVDFLRPLIPATIDVRLQCDVSEGLYIRFDEGEFQQVIMNLVVNARDAVVECGGDGAKGVISIACQKRYFDPVECVACHESIGEDFVVVSVSDTGAGVEREHLSKIFDPFFTTKAQGKGSGLGLALVNNAAHSYGGHLLVDESASEVSVGTCMSVLLPLQEAPVGEFPEDLISKVENHLPIESKLIMVVDDDESVAEFLCEFFHHLGHKTKQFSNSGNAIIEVNRCIHLYDMVFTDISMPEHTGVDLLNVIRAQDANISVVGMSATSDIVSEQNYADLGFNMFINKPLDVRCIEGLLPSLVS